MPDSKESGIFFNPCARDYVIYPKTDTMKLTAISLFVALLFLSCKKDKLETIPTPEIEEPTPKEYIIVGDSVSNDVEFTSYSPHISMQSEDFTEFYDIYLDSDVFPDFRLHTTSAYPLAGGWFNGSSVGIECLNSDAQVSIDPLHEDSLWKFPYQYELDDTLFQDEIWLNGNFLISYNGDVPNDGCSGPGCPNQSYGIWFGETEKYIGVRLNKDIPTLGWIKISLPSMNVNYGQILVVEEFGHVP
jgi:hypothetical protein